MAKLRSLSVLLNVLCACLSICVATRPPRTRASVLILFIRASSDLRELDRWSAASDESFFDVLLLASGATLGLLRDHPNARLQPTIELHGEHDEAALMNFAFGHARDAGYSQAILALRLSRGVPRELRRLSASASASEPLAVPALPCRCTTHLDAGRAQLVSPVLAIHIDGLARWLPNPLEPFDTHATNRPADALVRRMLASNVPPRLVTEVREGWQCDDASDIDCEKSPDLLASVASPGRPLWAQTQPDASPLKPTPGACEASGSYRRSSMQWRGRVAIIVAVHDALPFVRDCLAAVENHTAAGTYSMYLINDRSHEDTVRFLRAWAQERSTFVKVLNADNSEQFDGYSKAINRGIQSAFADPFVSAYVLLNSDTQVVSPRWLESLLAAAHSRDEIGIVGPLSNAASFQSVPELQGPLVNGRRDWSTNEMQHGHTPVSMGGVVLRASEAVLIGVPILNGFCMLIKREVIATVGLMDDVAFPHGFGEENDFCLRAARLGFALAVVDSVYIYHHKSKSFGVERRHQLSQVANGVLSARWGATLTAAVASLTKNKHLEATRRRIQTDMSSAPVCAPDATLRVLWVLPPIKQVGDSRDLMMHGGWISIFNQALGLQMRGACCKIAVSAWTQEAFSRNFPLATALLLPFSDAVGTPIELAAALAPHAREFDVAVATYYTTVRTVEYIIACHPRLKAAYFVQDYEPDFFAHGTSQRARASESYNLLGDSALLFAKTKWLASKVELRHNVTVSRIRAAVNLSSFAAARETRSSRDPTRPVSVVAMVRPGTSRRNPLATIRVLAALKMRLGDLVTISTFGCSRESFHQLTRDVPESVSGISHRGELAREEVAALFASADLFVDASAWQAFGRTGLEAMSAGCVPLLPAGSGASEYTEHGKNGMLVDTDEIESIIETAAALVKDPALLAQLRAGALETAAQFGIERASSVLMEKFLRFMRTPAVSVPSPPMSFFARLRGASSKTPRRQRRRSSGKSSGSAR